MPLARDTDRQLVQAMRPATTQQLTIGAAAVNATAVTKTVVRLCATTDVRVKISQAGTAATATDLLLPTNVVEYLGVTPGDVISAIQNAAAGVLSIVEMD